VRIFYRDKNIFKQKQQGRKWGSKLPFPRFTWL